MLAPTGQGAALPAAHGHWCAFTDLYHTIPCHTIPYRTSRSARAPDYIINGYGCPMQTISCTWRYVVPISENQAAHGHWCTFTDIYHAMPQYGREWPHEIMAMGCCCYP